MTVHEKRGLHNILSLEKYKFEYSASSNSYTYLCFGTSYTSNVNVIGKLIHRALNVRGCAPLNSDVRNFFGEPCVRTAMVLCRIRYYFVAVMGLGITFVSFLCYCSGHLLVLP